MNLDALLEETGVVANPTSIILAGTGERLNATITASATGTDHRPAPHRLLHRVPIGGRPVLRGSVRGRGPVRGRMSRRRLIALVGVACVAATAAVTVPLVGTRGSATQAEAVTVLRQAGSAAGRQSGGWPSATYWRCVSEYQRDGHTYRREIWIGRLVPSVLRDPGVAPGVLPLGQSDFDAGGTSLTWAQLYALPTGPKALGRVLRAGINGAGSGDDAELFVIVGDLLSESPASPALRRALFEVAADVPGVKALGPMKDSQGRIGQGVERDGEVIVVDTSTGRLLQEWEGGTAWKSVYLTQGPVSTAPAATHP